MATADILAPCRIRTRTYTLVYYIVNFMYYIVSTQVHRRSILRIFSLATAKVFFFDYYYFLIFFFVCVNALFCSSLIEASSNLECWCSCAWVLSQKSCCKLSTLCFDITDWLQQDSEVKMDELSVLHCSILVQSEYFCLM